jgi:hypothetical protein
MTDAYFNTGAIPLRSIANNPGFSAGVDPDTFRAEKFSSGFDPVWCDLLDKHKQKPFHCMVGGGDQIYCDSLTREPELQGWINAPDRKAKINFPLTEEFVSTLSEGKPRLMSRNWLLIGSSAF